MLKTVHVRGLERGDIQAIADIEDRVTGVSRPDYWAKRIDISEAVRPHWASLVAELDGRVVGFLFGRAGELEFGLPGTVAWIEIVGVHPAYRQRGVAAQLMASFTRSAEDHDIDRIFTIVDSENGEMQQFFAKQGFTQGRMLHFEKDVKS